MSMSLIVLPLTLVHSTIAVYHHTVAFWLPVFKSATIYIICLVIVQLWYFLAQGWLFENVVLCLLDLLSFLPDTFKGPIKLFVEILARTVFVAVFELPFVNVSFLVVNDLAVTRPISFGIWTYILFPVRRITSGVLAIKEAVDEITLDMHIWLNAYSVSVDKSIDYVVGKHLVLCLLISGPFYHHSASCDLVFY